MLNGAYKFFKNGKLQNIEEYKNGKRNGISQNFNPATDKIINESVYEKDVAVKSIFYYDNSSIFSLYEKDVNTNLFATKFYEASGKLIHQNNSNETNQLIGIHKNYTLINNEPVFSTETHFDNNGKKLKYIYNFNELFSYLFW